MHSMLRLHILTLAVAALAVLAGCYDDMIGSSSSGSGTTDGKPVTCARLLEVFPNISHHGSPSDDPGLRYIIVSGADCDHDIPVSVGWSEAPGEWETVMLKLPAGGCALVGASVSDNRNGNPDPLVATSWGSAGYAESWAVSLWQQGLPADGVKIGPLNWDEPHLTDMSDDPSPYLPVHQPPGLDWVLHLDPNPDNCE